MCGFISGLSLLSHWSVCLFLYHNQVSQHIYHHTELLCVCVLVNVVRTLELIFVYGVKYGSWFVFSSKTYCIYLFQQFLKKTFFSCIEALCTLVKKQLSICVQICFWTLCSVSLIYVSLLTSIPFCLNYCNFIVSPNIT